MAKSYSLKRLQEVPVNIPQNAMYSQGVGVWVFTDGNAFIACRKDYQDGQTSTIGSGNTENEAIVNLLENEHQFAPSEAPSEPSETTEDHSDETKADSEDNDDTNTADEGSQGSTEGGNLGSLDEDDDPPLSHQYDPKCDCIECQAITEAEKDAEANPSYLSCDADHKHCANKDKCKTWQQTAAGQRILAGM